MSTENAETAGAPEAVAPDAGADDPGTTGWSPVVPPTFHSPAADLNQLRNEAKRIADAAPGQPVHDSVLSRARALAAALEHDLGLPPTAEGLSYADLAVLLSQSR
ncbi:MAG: hypothetical protein FJW99_04030 [Actinobacteria bacterium]|nr:hypothetical protein [Actinomycetota bacterium]